MHPGPPSAAPVPGIGGWKTRPPEPQPNTTRLFIAAIIAVIVAGTATFLVLRARRVGEAPRPVGTERVCQLSPAAVARCAPMG